jgi:glycopeptide antibiotics resistance protein
VQSVIFPIWINIDNSSPVFSPSINIIPLYFGDCSVPDNCYSSIIDNIILSIPFGFGINFIVRVKPRYITWLAIALGLIFESSQLIPNLIFGGGFHVVDINDVIFNATGVLIGYGLFRLFALAFITIKNIFVVSPKWIFEDIYNVVLKQMYTDK